jgi:NAD(P)-dependent dehydrogenase (short-subunit alcohol dehydrogenase family)
MELPQFSLEGKIALVTGGSRGIGEAAALTLARAGADVAVSSRKLPDLERVAEQVEKLGRRALPVAAHVGRMDQIQPLVDGVVGELGSLDILVNNAGVLLLAAIADTELPDFERVVRVNQIGTFLGIKAVIGPMKQAGAGAIVNVSSVDVVCPEAGSPEMISPYIPDGVDVEQVIAHGQPHLAPQKTRSSGAKMRDIAQLVAFLASDASASCTGGDFPIDGGNTAGKLVRGAPGA